MCIYIVRYRIDQVLDVDTINKDFISNNFSLLPDTLQINANDIYHRCGDKKFTKRLLRRKKRTNKGHQVSQAEEQLSFIDLSEATATNLDQLISPHYQHRKLLREFYYSNDTISRDKRKKELRRRKFIDNLCSNERSFIVGGQAGYFGLNFVGDRGYAVNSPIKGFRKYGGRWKPSIHSRYCPTVITNEYNSSQTCVFCYRKTTHPIQIVGDKLKTINGTSVCSHRNCVLNRKGMSHQGRDKISSFAIGLAGLSRVALGSALPPFNQSLGHSNTEYYTQIATAFLNRSAEGLQHDVLDT